MQIVLEMSFFLAQTIGYSLGGVSKADVGYECVAVSNGRLAVNGFIQDINAMSSQYMKYIYWVILGRDTIRLGVLDYEE